ncbi:MAG: hypothetical protein WAO74_01465 [Polaribacter sp.]|uniref:hypothetical protein n=1 Tax=Polaribacter sp. TaxID=1920175 RepID=UPI003BB00399
MNSETVYQVAKALPKEEQLLLFEKLEKDFKIFRKNREQRKTVLTREEAMPYLLDHVFNKR